MEILAAIDKILQNIIVRWMLLVATALLSVAVTVQTARLTATELLLKAEKGQSAKYAAKIDTQNAAIKRAADDMALMQISLRVAGEKADGLAKKLRQRKVEIREVILQGTCPDMVQQVLDEVRR